jgi:ribonuclease R
MLCANICAAQFLLKHECPTLFRIHEGPSAEKLEDLRRFLGETGLKLPGKGTPTPLDYSKLLASIVDRPDAHVIQMVLLRSLSQAVYSPDNRGHFGLAFDEYAHFTSPIRRYPDLIVHRGIRKVLRKKHDLDKEESITVLAKQGEHCSMTERRADEATREVIDWLKCEFMLDKVGEEFDAIITNVTGFGFFVELKDYYQFDPTKQALLGERAGRKFRLSDQVRIRVVRVDLDQRQIDFMLAETLQTDIKKKPAKSKKHYAKEKSKKKKSPKKKR